MGGAMIGKRSRITMEAICHFPLFFDDVTVSTSWTLLDSGEPEYKFAILLRSCGNGILARRLVITTTAILNLNSLTAHKVCCNDTSTLFEEKSFAF
uniref:Uncharacterized protein n=1 Tax=Romanomermis culicivorax TaxID=13658 RepID=A0A915I7G1_ROMCU